MNKKWKWIIISISLLAIVCGGGYSYVSTQEKAVPSYTLGKVEKGNISLHIDATVTIDPINSVDLSANASGILEKVYVKQNEKVTVGQKLATIQSKALNSTREEAQNTLENKESYYNRLTQLYKQDAISYQALDNARLEYLNAKAAYDKAQAEVNDTVIISPLDGTVIGEPMKEGETVSQGLANQMLIMTVADLSSMQIQLLVDETDIGGVTAGQRVEFTVDAYPGKVFHGLVRNVSKKKYSGSSSAASSVIYYTVYVTINTDELEGLYPSMTARATIIGKENKDSLLVPVTAIRTDASGSYVYKAVGKELNKVYVKIGITTDQKVEILKGLSEGDEIVVNGTIANEIDAKSDSKRQRRP